MWVATVLVQARTEGEEKGTRRRDSMSSGQDLKRKWEEGEAPKMTEI